MLNATEVAAEIRHGITSGQLVIGASLHPLKRIADAFQVAPPVLLDAMAILQGEGYLNGSYVREDWRERTSKKNKYGATLMHHLKEVFDQNADVTLCVFTFTAETFYTPLKLLVEDIWSGKRTIRSLSVKLLVSSFPHQLVLPYSLEDPSDPFPLQRICRISQEYATKVVDELRALRTCEHVDEVHFEIRGLPQIPTSKVYLLNDRFLEALYIPEEAMTSEGKRIQDLRGWRRMDIDVEQGMERFELKRRWFDNWFKVGTPLDI